MNKNHGLVPTPITDKNGKRTTVYKKTPATSTSVPSIPAPAHSYLRSEYQKSLAVVFRRIDDANSGGFAVPLSDKLQSATNEELAIFAATLSENPELEETLTVAVKECDWKTIVSLALVYSPEYSREQSPQRRMHMLRHALEQAYVRIKGEYPRFDRSLADEGMVMRGQVQRYVAAKIAYYMHEVELSDDLIDRLLDHSRTDHDETIGILRANPHATIEQIDFALAGGTKSLSSGAL